MARPQVKVPLVPCEHYYLHTKPLDNLDPMTPGNIISIHLHYVIVFFCNLYLSSVIRDPDGFIYLRERDGCILAGGFEPVAKSVYDEESKCQEP